MIRYLLCLTCTAFLAASELNLSGVSFEKEEFNPNYNRRTIPYVQLSPELSKLMPGVGFGVRSESDEKAVDVSLTYSSRKDEEYCCVAYHPKLLYLTYHHPREPESFFYGLAGAWGTVVSEEAIFSGLMGGLAAGYETGRDSSIRQITTLEALVPTISFYHKNPQYFPAVSLTYSLGF